MKWWKKKVERSFTLWYDEKGNHQDNDGGILTAGEDAIQRAKACSWWKWELGSSIFFWRWADFYQRRAREGHVPMFIGEPPLSKIPQPEYEDNTVRQKVKDKIQRVMD